MNHWLLFVLIAAGLLSGVALTFGVWELVYVIARKGAQR